MTRGIPVLVASVLVVVVATIAGCGREKPAPERETETPQAAQVPKKTYPNPPEGAVLLDAPATLDREGAVYFLTRDVTADGTAFTIVEDNITLDLGGRTVVYNAKPSDISVHAVVTKNAKHKRRLGTGVYNITVRNGVIVQGTGATKGSAALSLGGQFCTGYDVHHLDVRVHGVECPGIAGTLNDSQVHHNYVESHATTERIDGGGCDAIRLGGSLGGLTIAWNVIAGGHRGITVGSLATYNGTYLEQLGGHRNSVITGNLIQHKRLEKGNKAPYGIALFHTHETTVCLNQIVSDNGRGIILDGGKRAGSTGNMVGRNLIDVQYSSTVTEGAYVENRVYGIRDRYASGQNVINRNTIFVTNGVDGYIAGIYIGSDEKDPRMDDIRVRENIIHASGGAKDWLGPGSTGIVLDWVDNITVERNVITSDRCPIVIRHAEEKVTIKDNRLLRPADASEWTAVVNENELTFTGTNTEGDAPTDTEAPAVPTGLTLTKHLDAYVLRWEPSRKKVPATSSGDLVRRWDATEEDDVRGYIVYRDGQRLPISPRGGRFYVDLGLAPGRRAVYQVSAVDLSGNESRRSEKVRTDAARPGWEPASE